MNALLLALAMVAAEDPVKGSRIYLPKIGERAILHDYDPDEGKVFPTIQAWTNTTALVKYNEGFESKAFKEERARVLGDRKKLDAVLARQIDILLKGPESRGEVTRLPDMTPVSVRVLATFEEQGLRIGLLPPLTDNILIEVLEGPQKGRFFWVSRAHVRVPDAPEPEFGGFGGATFDPGKLNFGEEGEKSKPAPPPRPTAKLLIEDSSWERKLDFVQVHCRVRNMTDQAIERVTATVTYQDAAGKMVSTGVAIVGTLQPGEAKTFSTLDPHNPRMQGYVFEFEGRVDGENAGLTFTTTPPRNRRGR
jgi:hypothetical protein